MKSLVDSPEPGESLTTRLIHMPVYEREVSAESVTLVLRPKLKV